MGTNPFFNGIRSLNEQNVVEDLVIESIKIHGMDVLYLPRTFVNKNTIFGEDPISRFGSAKPIEMYLESVNGFDGQGDILSKFGLQVKDSASLTVSKSRFIRETGMVRPMEGDIIYLPLTKGFFEIKFVEHENPFYQMGKNYVFKLSVELFQYSEEEFVTGETEIDSVPLMKEFLKYLTIGPTSGTGSIFSVGDIVYQYTNGSITGGLSLANCSGTVSDSTSSLVTIRNIKGNWLPTSEATTRYVTLENGSSYRTVTSVDDTINISSNADNKQFQTESDAILDFTESNPFGDP